MTIWAFPDTTASVAFRRSATVIWPVNRVGRRRAARSGPSVFAMDRRCWEASTSVGASSADCPPESATASMARNATSVLPDPTSPCSSRFMGDSDAMSRAISSPTTVWSPVRVNGIAASNSADSVPGIRGAAALARSTARCRSSAAWRTNASWNRSALCAERQSASFCGRWMSSSARE